MLPADIHYRCAHHSSFFFVVLVSRFMQCLIYMTGARPKGTSFTYGSRVRLDGRSISLKGHLRDNKYWAHLPADWCVVLLIWSCFGLVFCILSRVFEYAAPAGACFYRVQPVIISIGQFHLGI